jgi:putative intracellular protease/amidase
MMKHTESKQTMNVAFLIYNQVEVLDLNGPLDVFVKANVLDPDCYTCYTVGKPKILFMQKEIRCLLSLVTI